MSSRIAAIVIGLALALASAAASASPRIEFRDGRLSAELHGEPAESAFRAIEAETGVHVRAPKSLLAKPITVNFRDLVVEAGMRQIVRSLAVSGYAVLYGPDGPATVTYVLLDSTAPFVPTAAPAPLPAAKALPPDHAALIEASKQRREASPAFQARQRKKEERERQREEKKLSRDERKREREEARAERKAEHRAAMGP